RDLNNYDHPHVCQTLFCLRHVTVSHQKPGPRADDSHNTPGSADELVDLHETDDRQSHYTCAGDESSHQVAHGKSNCSYGSFQRRTEDIKRKNIEKQMGKTPV